MSLTGLPLLVLLAVLTAAGFFAVVRFWPRLAGRGPRALIGRVGALAVAQVLLLATVLAAANNYFGFYGSWHDLVSVATGNYAASAPAPLGAAQNGSGITVNSHSTLPIPGGADPTQGGRLDDVTVRGQLTGLSAHALIYLPPQYFQAGYRKTLFPAVIVSSGYPGDVTKLVTLLRYPARLVDGINAGQDKPMVLVMMSPMIISGRDTECTDVAGGGPRAGEFWAMDVTSAVERTYRVSSDASGWGLVGDSTGGYCALKLAMLNSDRFSAAASLSGYFDALQDGTTGDLYGGDPVFRQQNDLLWRIEHLPSPPIAALLTTSRTGETNYGPTMQFVRDAKPPMRVSTLIRASGGHNFNTWNAEVPAALQWLSSHLIPATG
ncbi:MAG TPA: alpha/beta hydrolase-fold protein [Actinocrinis sp.]|uniref:alpha/beta hydrolase n=1 Tax=Actinocrinis sp. TaxID=1920516 RepID=UPI002D36EE9F|nr:alpha/beta hydrolase-fold protein [Actinocrinis sp.]HZU59059.1 alpha/beta hydrolase-fold protein [Actinocrinis sp.]